MLFLSALARAAEQRMGIFNAQEVGNIAWAFVQAERLDVLLFVFLTTDVERRVGDFDPGDLANTA